LQIIAPLKERVFNLNENILSITQRAIASDNIKSKKCFACGENPISGRGEHVLPLWLQSKHNLHEERLRLLNGTYLRYRQLTIPCCTKCNTGFLSRIEREVQAVLGRGEIQSQVEHLAVGRWLAKIFYGLLVKETSLLKDRRFPAFGNILESDFLEDLTHCSLIFQSARKETRFECLHGPFPFTLYWYKIEKEADAPSFHLVTNLFGQSIALRSGAIGLVFVNDGGLQLEAGPKGPFGLSGATVTAIQFSELVARAHYKAALRDATHFYLNWESDELLALCQQHVRPLSRARGSGDFVKIFDDWNESDFSKVASALTQLDETLFFDPSTDTRRTLLANLLAESIVTEGQ
jgi:hypothetical protein